MIKNESKNIDSYHRSANTIIKSENDCGFVAKNSNRIKLEDHIPLKYPLVLTIEPTNKCNYSCRFCPNRDKEYLKSIGRPTGTMTLDLYNKIIDDLKSSNAKIKSLSLHKDGEPLLSKNLGDMIRIARESQCFDNITVTTNGSLLSESKAKELLNSGLTYLRFSIESTKTDRYQWITKTKYKADRVYKNIAAFREMRDKMGLKAPWIYVKMVAFPTVKDELEDFKKLYEDIADEVNIETPMNWNGGEDINFLDEVDTENECKLDEVFGYYDSKGNSGIKACCPLPWYSMSVNHNGTVGVCGVDWKHDTLIGDVTKQHLINEIWNGDRMISFREMHVNNHKHDNAGCKSCSFLNTYPDNIDEFVKQYPEKVLSLPEY